jgi:hypothetical protein
VTRIDQSIHYDFKLADFGLAQIYQPGQEHPPIPRTLSSLNQNPRFSESNYDPDDDLYGVGYLMFEMQLYLHNCVHPDPEYIQLAWNLIHKTERCNITYALGVVERKCREMIINSSI